MTHLDSRPVDDTQPDTVEHEVDLFVRRLIAQGLAEHTARLETKLHWAGSPDPLLAADRAMTAAWSHERAHRPPHALLWIAETGSPPQGWLSICAYDAQGWLLLDQRCSAPDGGALLGGVQADRVCDSLSRGRFRGSRDVGGA